MRSSKKVMTQEPFKADIALRCELKKSLWIRSYFKAWIWFEMLRSAVDEPWWASLWAASMCHLWANCFSYLGVWCCNGMLSVSRGLVSARTSHSELNGVRSASLTLPADLEESFRVNTKVMWYGVFTSLSFLRWLTCRDFQASDKIRPHKSG